MAPEENAPRPAERHRLIESLRVVLAIITGLLMLDAHEQAQTSLAIGVLAFSLYAVTVLWYAANGSLRVQARIFHWLDTGWFLLLIFLAGEARTHYFAFLFFPVFFAAWRTGYRESVALAAVSGLSSLMIIAVREPDISWTRLLAMPLALFVVAPLFVALSRVEAANWQNQAFAARLVEYVDPRRGFERIVPDLMAQIARQFDASAALVALRTFEGRRRVFCWETEEGPSELSESAAVPVAERALSLPDGTLLGFSSAHRCWRRPRLIEIGQSGLPRVAEQADRDTVVALAGLVGKPCVISVAIDRAGIGRMRLVLAGDSLDIEARALQMLMHIVEQIGPSLDNAILLEQLITESADTQTARIGRDLHDSAIQPYIGLKFALEAVRRRAGLDNPVAADLARLVQMATAELTNMREVISGLRGAPGNGGAMLASAVRRQASRFAQIFGIEVEVEVEGEMPVSRRIAGELFHMVAEGLSNIRRHTQARRAWISLRTADDVLVLSIRNENDVQALATADFTPISLTERAYALGGSIDVESSASGTTVTARVPIPGSKSTFKAQSR